MWGKENVHISALKRQYKVCNFGLKAEIYWSLKQGGETSWPLKWRERPACHSSKPITFCVCVLHLLYYFIKRVRVTEERYVQTLSRIPTTHNRCRQRIKNIDYIFYIPTSPSLFVWWFDLCDRNASGFHCIGTLLNTIVFPYDHLDFPLDLMYIKNMEALMAKGLSLYEMDSAIWVYIMVTAVCTFHIMLIHVGKEWIQLFSS